MSTGSLPLAAIDGLQTPNILTEILDQADASLTLPRTAVEYGRPLVPASTRARNPHSFPGYKRLRSPLVLVSSLTGRTSMLPTRAGGICDAT